MRRHTVDREVAHSRSVLGVGPKVPNGILPASTNPWRFGKAEEHVGWFVEGVQLCGLVRRYQVHEMANRQFRVARIVECTRVS